MAKGLWPLWTNGCDPPCEVPPHVRGAAAGPKPACAMESTGAQRAGTRAQGTAGSCPRLRPPPALPLRGTLLPAVGARWHRQHSAAKDGAPQPQHGPRPHAGHVHPRGAPLLRTPQARTTGEPMPRGDGPAVAMQTQPGFGGTLWGAALAPQGMEMGSAGLDECGSACSPHP